MANSNVIYPQPGQTAGDSFMYPLVLYAPDSQYEFMQLAEIEVFKDRPIFI